MIDPPDAALGAARTLALTRIVAGLVIVTSADVHSAARFAAVPGLLVSPPPGLAWLGVFDLSLTQATALTWIVVVAALLGALGAYARVAFGMAALGLFVLLALSHRMGAVIHSHHLLWAATLLAASPCADVWSVDAYFEPRALRPRAQYAASLFAFRALVACIYFFPGLYKLVSFASGSEPGAWMRSHLAWKWLQHGTAPTLFVNLAPVWFGPLALAALAFELSMPVLVAFRRTRPLALLGAIAFHVGTALLLFIRFDSLAAVLASLLDLAPTKPERTSLRDTLRGALRPTLWVGSTLVIGAFASGAAGATQLYPFACYPTFADQAPATMPSARVILMHEGSSCALPRPSDSAEWIAAFRIAGAYGDRLSGERARAYLQRILRTKLHATHCALNRQTGVALVLEDLAWDFGARRARVVKQRVAYSAAISALGMAPAEGNKAPSSPLR